MKAPTDNTLLCVSLLTALLVFSSELLSQTSELSGDLERPEQVIPEPPSNWYQVEIVLFTQQGNTGLEAPPKRFHLQFPENWQELGQGNTSMSTIASPLVSDSPTAELLPGATALSASNTLLFSTDLSLATVEETLDDLVLSSPVPEASIPYLNQQSHDAELTLAADSDLERSEEMPEPFVPQYEKSYQILEAQYRDLNESAAALNRRQYNVVLHQAWRMPIEPSDISPWVLIKAGPTATDRYLIEGAVRFYKSRFLHFEANLWRLKFSNDESNLLQLPEIPKTALSAHQIVTLNAQVFAQQLEHLGLVPTRSEQTDLADNNSTNQKAGPNEYPVETVWVMNKSQRLQQDQVYYIDHPEMGALVTIKAYLPPLLNPPSAAPTDNQPSEVTELAVIATDRDAAPR